MQELEKHIMNLNINGVNLVEKVQIAEKKDSKIST